MDPMEFLSSSVTLFGDRTWSSENVLRFASELAQHVNSLSNISGKDKTELVCQTILKMLDDGEKAEKERAAVSTEKETTKIPWNECRESVKLLPHILDLVVSASRGKLGKLGKLGNLDKLSVLVNQNCLRAALVGLTSLFSRMPSFSRLQNLWSSLRSFSCFEKKNLTEVFSVQDPLSEMRTLVSKVEAILEEAKSLRQLPLPSPLPEAPQLPQLPEALQSQPLPTPVLDVVTLPGELENHVAVEDIHK
jgi:hypothetical protein